MLETDLAVWMDDNIWDAFLIKDESGWDPRGTLYTYKCIVHRIQLLYNVKTKTFFFWHNDSLSLVPAMTPAKNSKSAPADFEKFFEEKTGLSWSDRWDVPKEGKSVFVPHVYVDDEIENTSVSGYHKDKQSDNLSPSVYDVLSVIFDHTQKLQMNKSVKRVSGGRLKEYSTWTIRHTLRAGISLLGRIREIILDRFQRKGDSRAKALISLGKCYLGLMWNSTLDAPPKWKLPARSEDRLWVKRERDALELLYNLSFAFELMGHSTKVSRNQILNRAYRGLGLAKMSPVKVNTAEYKALVEYLTKTSATGVHHRSKVCSIVPGMFS